MNLINNINMQRGLDFENSPPQQYKKIVFKISC